MRKYLSLLALLWFVGLRAPHPTQAGVVLTMIVGPFQTVEACGEFRKGLLLVSDDMPGSEVSECTNAA